MSAAELEARRARIAGELARTASFEESRVAARSGLPCVVLCGAQNAGKSSLFNALVGSQRALVSEVAGTTRDALTAEIRVGDVELCLSDTAGLDPGASGPDGAAQSVAVIARESADLALWVVDAAAGPDRLPANASEAPQEVASVLAWNKVDRPDARPSPPTALVDRGSVRAWVATSAVTGRGLVALRAQIASSLSAGAGGAAGESSSVARELGVRHAAGLAEAASELELGFRRWRSGGPLELLAEHLRRATSALDAITGATTAEAVLDRLFARFCIGK